MKWNKYKVICAVYKHQKIFNYRELDKNLMLYIWNTVRQTLYISGYNGYVKEMEGTLM